MCIEESVHVVFDESGDLKSLEMKDDDDFNELFKIQNNEANMPEAEGNQDSNSTDPGPSEKMNEDVQPTKGPGPSHDASQEENHSLEKEEEEEEEEEELEEEQTNQP
ncbi:hypothetical protein KY284_013109 [Solanum tuberosum]|nr:hypothetical protein KY284_013109 [Solanum tuberosum]